MFLQERQLAFKREALKAKQKGDMELAKKYLRQAMVRHEKNLVRVLEKMHIM